MTNMRMITRMTLYRNDRNRGITWNVLWFAVPVVGSLLHDDDEDDDDGYEKMITRMTLYRNDRN